VPCFSSSGNRNSSSWYEWKGRMLPIEKVPNQVQQLAQRDESISKWKRKLNAHNFRACIRTVSKPRMTIGRKKQPRVHQLNIDNCNISKISDTYDARLQALFNVSKIKIKWRILYKHMTEIWKISNSYYANYCKMKNLLLLLLDV